MTDNSVSLSIPLKFEIRTPPRGMTDYDPKALTPEQQTELNLHKLNVRKENLLYLKDHPEVKAIVVLVVRKTIIQRPRSIVQFISELFNRPDEDIRRDINAILNEKELEFEYIPFSEYQPWDY